MLYLVTKVVIFSKKASMLDTVFGGEHYYYLFFPLIIPWFFSTFAALNI